MSELSGSKGLKLGRSIYIFVLLMGLSGCITVRMINEENGSTRPELTSQPGVTVVSPTLSPSPIMFPTQQKIIEIPQPAIQPDTWYFFAVTRQGRTVTIYLDGRAVSFGDFDPLNLDAPIALLFGRQEGSNGSYLDGRIDEVEIYNGTALSPQQIYMLYSAGSSGKCKGRIFEGCVHPPGGLTAWWPGDGSTQDMVSSRNGTFMRDASTGPGMVGEAFVLDGKGDYIEVPDDPALNFGTGDFTIDLWVNFDDLSGDQTLIEKWIQEEASNHPISQGWILTYVGDRVWFVMDDGSEGDWLIAIQPQTYLPATPTTTPTASP